MFFIINVICVDCITASLLQVDSAGIYDMKLKLNELEISVRKKEKEIDDHKKTIANLTSAVTQLQTTVNNLQELVGDISSQVKILADKNSNEEFGIFKWIIPVHELKQCEQYSEPYYITSGPFLLQLSAAIKGKKLEVWLYRCRGKNDIAGKIATIPRIYRCIVYLVNISGNVFSRSMEFRTGSDLNIGAAYQRSRGTGYDDFFKTSTSNWNEWVIKDHLHLICKLEPNFN